MALTQLANSVLIVDDDVDIREALMDTLEEKGFHVITASHGLEALALLKAMPVLPAIILLDLMMPVLDGYRFLEAQRRDPELASIPVAVITAGHGVDRERLGEAVRVVPKPIKVAFLIRVMHELAGAGAAP
jgi:CheY-like chemotaxis protein